MARTLILVVMVCVLNTFVYVTANEPAAAKTNDSIKFEVGGKTDESNIKNLFLTMTSKPADDTESGDGSGGDDTEIYSGSGSGEIDDGTPIDVKTTATPPKKPTKSISKSTVMIINEVTSKPTTKVIDMTTHGNEIVTGGSTTSGGNNVGARQDDGEGEDKPGIDFTVGIIVGVVVGAILAILVIVFLVYRLRKKDEGSYSLDEQSSQAFIRDEKNGGGQGKEYFA